MGTEEGVKMKNKIKQRIHLISSRSVEWMANFVGLMMIILVYATISLLSENQRMKPSSINPPP